MPPQVIIRDARPDEREAIQSLTLVAYEQYATIMGPLVWAGLKAAILSGLSTTTPAQRIVAEQDGKIVGSVMLFPPDVHSYGGLASESSVPELRLLAVLPDSRGHGIGQALMDECVRRAREMGAAELGLHTSKSMQAAIRMYERMGFYRVPADDFQPPGAELVTAYRLKLISEKTNE